MIKTKIFVVNGFREATYLVYDQQTKEGIVIDSGLSNSMACDRFNDYVDRHEIKIVKAVNTHCHIDHICGVGYIKDRYKVDFYASKKDQLFVDRFEKDLGDFGMDPLYPLVKTIDHDILDGDIIKFGNSSLRAIATPGHTMGSMVFFDEETNALFTGDTIFKGSIGRTDLPGGDYHQLMKSILENIVPLGKDVTIYPGHGDHTTLSDELMYNPFITEVLQGEVNY